MTSQDQIHTTHTAALQVSLRKLKILKEQDTIDNKDRKEIEGKKQICSGLFKYNMHM